jgi:hypothetical protein
VSEGIRVRWGWLRFMYAYTIVGAGCLGVALILVPDVVVSAFKWPEQDPIVMGVMASVYAAFGALSGLGLRAPLRFAPVLCLQLCYKSIWFVGVVVPLLVTGELPPHALVFMGIFASYIIGDLIAIPFPVVLARDDPRTTGSAPGA